MLRILLLVLIGFIVGSAILQTVGGVIAFAIDMKKGGGHAPEILGGMTASLLIALGLGWVWKKVYCWKKDASPAPRA